jgi:hypothetical protein
MISTYLWYGRAVHQGRQGRDQVDAAVMPFLRRQRRPSSAPRAGLQAWQFHADACDAQDGGTVVADQPAREADQDRRQSRQPWPLRHLPNGRGRSVAPDAGTPVADRPAAGTARASMRSAAGQMRKGTTAEVSLDQGKSYEFQRREAGNVRLSLPRESVIGDILLCRRPKSETMALVGTGIWRISAYRGECV